MPYIRITVAGEKGLAESQREELQAAFTRDVHQRLGKRREVTAVAIIEVPASAWAIDGRAVARAAHVEIAITAGTNSAAEKAAMIEAADACLRATLGLLPEATYVIIQEIAGEAWGYHGRTQQARLGKGARP